MNNKFFVLIVVILLVFGVGISINVSKNTANTDKINEKIINEEVPVAIDEIDYELVKSKNKEGYVLIYIKYENNSKHRLDFLSVGIKGDPVGEITIENLISTKPGTKSDNFDLSKSKDDRTKIPVKDLEGKYMKDYFEYDIYISLHMGLL